ncbi:HDIG domain-containing protein [Streptococcus sp. X16XC17]|uniref:bis(5'-nucleosyl)-tetraphosphatase (symmetrical) YqeK n=1 Tax=unclassified Streptococcus TaxID=2608887 RepID=UPI00066FDCF8|nr:MULTISPECIES: bis(5'-nucleosyl)-tetraphosphatase (symmetrical) YqeK [unclassified Streptococcus]TCD46745.1 HDIG domain-containing protein [Streptococcus sp. X16XC17]
MDYSAYIDLSRQELLEKVQSAMGPKRFEHVLGVEKAALELAARYNADATKASLAALLHDYAKERPDQDFLDIIDQYGLDQGLKNWGNNIWHGMVGSHIIRQEFGLEDDEILQAVERHTVGASQMTLLDKVLYVADYIEPGRDFPDVDEARAIAKQDLDQAVAYETAHTIAHLASKGIPIYPQILETYNAYVKYLKDTKKK